MRFKRYSDSELVYFSNFCSPSQSQRLLEFVDSKRNIEALANKSKAKPISIYTSMNYGIQNATRRLRRIRERRGGIFVPG
jgi:hypothetical protein